HCDVAKKYRLYGIAIYRLGAEDESMWETLKKVASTPTSTANLLPAEPPPPVVQNLRPIDFFTDDTANTDAYAYPTDGEKEARHGGAKYLVIYKQGKRWWDVQCEGDQWSGAGIGCPTRDIGPYRQHGALQFYVRGFEGGEVFDVGVASRKSIK